MSDTPALAPVAERPHMPGYGLRPAGEGTGLLPWAWAVERLTTSRSYWLATVWPDRRPHIMPVWGVFDAGCLWFSSSLGSRKIRNLVADPRCSVTTEDPTEPVVVEGIAELVTETAALRRLLELENRKYDTDYGIEMLDPAQNATVRIHPRWAFGLLQSDFTGSPTRWRFDEGDVALRSPTAGG